MKKPTITDSVKLCTITVPYLLLMAQLRIFFTSPATKQ